MQPMTIQGFINTLWGKLKLWWDGLMNSVCETLRAKCPHPTSPPPPADKETIPPFRLVSNLPLLIPASAGRDSSEEAAFSPLFLLMEFCRSVVLRLRTHTPALQKVPAACRRPCHPKAVVVYEGRRALTLRLPICKFANFFPNATCPKVDVQHPFPHHTLS